MNYLKLSLVLILFSILSVNAQDSKSVFVNQPGTLYSQFSGNETYTLKNLIISGKLNAYDFKFLSQNFNLLESIDLSSCTIYSYSGSDGPTWSSTVYYPENELPQNSFSSTYVNTGVKYIYGRKTLKSVILPSTISSIGTDAFNECTALTSIKFPATLKAIKDYAFQNCTSLTSIQNLAATPPLSGIDALNGINAGACMMTVPTSAVSLYQADPAWKNFNTRGGGFSLYVLNSNEYAGDVSGQEYRFYSLNEVVKLKALSKNSKISLNWSENGKIVSTDSIYLFNMTTNRRLTVNFRRELNINTAKPGTLIALIKDPQTVTHLILAGSIDARDIRFIRDSLKALQNLDLTQTSIYSYYGSGGSYVSSNLYNENMFPTWAFFTYNLNQGNRYMKTVKLPSGIVSIEYNSFNNCRNLDSITIPQGVTSIKEYAFGYCNSLKSITNLAIQPATVINTTFTEVPVSTCELLVPAGSEAAYKAAPYWSSFIIKTGGYSVSAKCNNNLIGSVNGIENRFYTPNEVLKLKAKAINGAVFKNWTENGVVISNDSTLEISINNNRQLYANFGQSATIKTDRAGTLKDLISNPNVITSLSISGKLDVRDFKFMRDSIPSLESLDISNTQILAYTVPNTSTSYKDNELPYCAFSVESYPCPGMKFLKNITLPQGMTSIGERAFYNCFALENVNMPVSLSNISSNAFGYCSALKTLTLPPFLSSVGYTAFQNCSSLKTVNNFSLSPSVIDNNTFSGLTLANCNLLIPVGYSTVYKSASVWNTFNVAEGGYVLTAVSNERSTGTVSGTENRFYTQNEAVKVQCSALNGTTFKNWTADGKVVSTDPVFTFNVVANQNLIANFSKELTVRVDSAGTLRRKITDLLSTTKLTVTGNIDARDFQFMRDSIPSLEDLDLSKASVVAYTGKATYWESLNYNANTLPISSFYNTTTSLGKISLKSIILPDSLKVIDSQSFQGCSNLTSVGFPSKLTTIYGAFGNCSSLTTMVIPSTVTTLSGSFSGCTKLSSVILPENLKSIAQEMFKNCVNLQSIQIPESVTSISYSAFQGCSSLKKLKLPDGLTTIYHFAFSHCTGLDSLKLPSKLYLIDDYTFEACTGLKYVKLPDALSALNAYAFVDCSGLKKIVFPRKLKSIGSNAFQNCTALESIDFPDDLNSLGYYSFSGCTGLQEVKIPNRISDLGTVFNNCSNLKKVVFQTGLKRITGYAFENCTSLTSISIPTGVTYISSGAFEGCSSLTEVNLPAGLTNIGSSAFSGCSSLKSIQLPSGFTKLEGMTFNNCSSLTSVTLPVELSSMFMLEFYHCNKLAEIINLNPVPLPTSSLVNTFNEMDLTKCKLTVQSSSVNAYKVADIWKNFIIQDGGYSVIASASNSMIGTVTGANRFYQPNEAATLEAKTKLGSSFVNWTENGTVVSTSPVYKFTVSSNRKLLANFVRELSVNIPNAGNLRDSVFDSNSVSKLSISGSLDARDIKFLRDNMSLLSSIDMSNATIVAYSGAEGTADGYFDYPANALPISAFVNDSILKAIVLNKDLTVIDDQSFKDCVKLSQCVIPESVVVIGSNAFNNCTALNSIKLPGSLKTIEYAAFVNCNKLTSLQFPSGLETIGSSVFVSCSGLTSVSLPLGLKKLGDSSFSGCTGLTKVVFPASLSVIEMLTFSNCSNITSLEFSEGLTQISYGAFSACSGIQNILFPSSLSMIGTGAFGSCTGLKEMTLSPGLTAISMNAFYSCSALKKITNPNAVPLSITSDVFSGVNQSTCTLIVPIGSENLYKNASVWKKFIVSGSGYSISATSNSPLVGYVSGLTTRMYAQNDVVTITAKTLGGAAFVNWTENGAEVSTDSVLTFTVSCSRKLTANFKREEILAVTGAGTLINVLKSTTTITSLILSGTINATDIKYIRDNFPSLISLNLKEAHIAAYNGNAGTNQFVSQYPENELPVNSFYDSYTGSHSSLQTIELPDDLDSIGSSAFINCSTLRSINLPVNLKSIESRAFYGCTALDSITLPSGLQYIKPASFSNCDALKKITNLNPQPVFITNDVFTYTTFKTCKLIVPDASVELYKVADMWKGFFEIRGLSSLIDSVSENSSLIIYPIPATDMINIRNTGTINIQSVRIYDSNGKLCWISDVPVSRIDVSWLRKNKYFIQLITTDKPIVKSFVKN